MFKNISRTNTMAKNTSFWMFLCYTMCIFLNFCRMFIYFVLFYMFLDIRYDPWDLNL